MRRIRLIVAIISLVMLTVPRASARLIFNNEFVLQHDGTSWVIDALDDTVGNIVLQFGALTNESMYWDVTNQNFVITDDLLIDGNADLNGNQLTLDKDGGVLGADTSIVFGGGTGENISWDNTNSRFAVSDDWRIEGNNSVVGDLYVGQDHTASSSDGYINLGRDGSNWEHIQWDSAINSFEVSDDWLPDTDLTYDLGSAAQRWRKIYVDAIQTGGSGTITFGQGSISFDFTNGQSTLLGSRTQTIEEGDVVKVASSGTLEVILTNNKNDQPIGVAANSGGFGDTIKVIILGKAYVNCTGSVTQGTTVQTSNTDGFAEQGVNATKIVGTSLSGCIGGKVNAVIHLN